MSLHCKYGFPLDSYQRAMSKFVKCEVACRITNGQTKGENGRLGPIQMLPTQDLRSSPLVLRSSAEFTLDKVVEIASARCSATS